MPALNFQAQWADAVELGARFANCEIAPVAMLDLIPKRTTIRRPGRVKPGDTLHLFTGQRTKECRKLGQALCLAVTPITIGEPDEYGPVIFLAGRGPSPAECEALARLDTAGLWGAAELITFFRDTYGLPFKGELICW